MALTNKSMAEALSKVVAVEPNKSVHDDSKDLPTEGYISSKRLPEFNNTTEMNEGLDSAPKQGTKIVAHFSDKKKIAGTVIGPDTETSATKFETPTGQIHAIHHKFMTTEDVALGGSSSNRFGQEARVAELKKKATTTVQRSNPTYDVSKDTYAPEEEGQEHKPHAGGTVDHPWLPKPLKPAVNTAKTVTQGVTTAQTKPVAGPSDTRKAALQARLSRATDPFQKAKIQKQLGEESEQIDERAADTAHGTDLSMHQDAPSNTPSVASKPTHVLKVGTTHFHPGKVGRGLAMARSKALNHAPVTIVPHPGGALLGESTEYEVIVEKHGRLYQFFVLENDEILYHNTAISEQGAVNMANRYIASLPEEQVEESSDFDALEYIKSIAKNK